MTLSQQRKVSVQRESICRSVLEKAQAHDTVNGSSEETPWVKVERPREAMLLAPTRTIGTGEWKQGSC